MKKIIKQSTFYRIFRDFLNILISYSNISHIFFPFKKITDCIYYFSFIFIV